MEPILISLKIYGKKCNAPRVIIAIGFRLTSADAFYITSLTFKKADKSMFNRNISILFGEVGVKYTWFTAIIYKFNN